MDLWAVSEESYKNGYAAGYAKGQLDSMKIMKEMLNKITVLHSQFEQLKQCTPYCIVVCLADFSFSGYIEHGARAKQPNIIGR